MKNTQYAGTQRTFTLTSIATAAILLLLAHTRTFAQCSVTASYGASPFVFLNDTTLYDFYADTSTYHYSAHTSFVWGFSDGTIQHGQTVIHKFTQANQLVPTFTYTLTVVDTSAVCRGIDNGSMDYPPVFNCSYLGTTLNYFHNYGIGCNDLVLDMTVTGITSDLSRNPFLLLTENLWGDGSRTVDTNYGTTFPTSGITHRYAYQGVYKIQSNYTAVNQYTGTTCPVVSTPLRAEFVVGQFTRPVVSVGTTVCEGDTIRLIAHDTTAGFYNMAGATDLTGVTGPIDTTQSNDYRYYWEYHFDSTIPTWGPFGDTVLVIPAASARDTLFRFVRENTILTCGSTSQDQWVRITVVPTSLCATRVSQIDSKSSSVYPNPANGLFMVTLPEGAKKIQISVLDVTGRVVNNVNQDNTVNNKITINLSDQTEGTYILQVSIDGKTYHDRVVIRK